MQIYISLLYLLILQQPAVYNLLNCLYISDFPRSITLEPIKHANWHVYWLPLSKKNRQDSSIILHIIVDSQINHEYGWQPVFSTYII